MKNMNNMKKLYLPIAIMFLFVHVSFAQNFQLSFTGIGESTEIDSVIVKNLNLGVETKVGGYDVVNLAPAASLRFAQQTGDDLVIYPNPAYDYCTIELLNPEQNNVYIDVFDVSGKLLIREQYNLEKGIHRFRLNGMASGLYTISVKSNRFHYNGKIVSTSNTNKTLDFNYIDSYAFAEDLPLLSHTKASFDLAYNYGDVLWFEAQSDAGHRTVQTLILNEADAGDTYQNLDFEFITCQDAEGFMYSVIEMGNHHWMAENLNTSKYRDSSNIAKVDDTNEWIELTSGAYCNYDNNNSNPKLYNWYAATSSKGLCPTGWHTPADFEWKRLEQHIGLTQQQTDAIGWRGSGFGNYLKESGTDNWLSHTGTGLNTSGFTAVPGGIRNFAGEFYYSTTSATWWSSTENLPPTAWCRGLFFDKTEIYRKDGRKIMGFSIRCMKNYLAEINTNDVTNVSNSTANVSIQILNNGGTPILSKGIVWSTFELPTVLSNDGYLIDESNNEEISFSITGLASNTTYYLRSFATNEVGTNYGDQLVFTTQGEMGPQPCPDVPTVTDVNGNIYNTVKIGNQCWMKENYKAINYSDSQPVSHFQDSMSWVSAGVGAYCYYNNDSAQYADEYGALYNFYAIESGTLCPEGWKVPQILEWLILTDYLGGDHVAGGKMKEAGTDYWLAPNTGATNQSGFTALPGGIRLGDDSNFTAMNEGGAWWMNYDDGDTFLLYTSYDSDSLFSEGATRQFGVSVRCVKEVEPIAGLPLVSTYEVFDNTSTSANSGGYVEDDGGYPITACGVVCRSNGLPSLSNNEGMTNEGSLSGEMYFYSELTNLTPNKTYLLRAYATNSVGTAYGDIVFFDTYESYDYGEPCPDEPTVTDIDGNLYTTIMIGSQCWLRENLKVERYTDGTAIPYPGTDNLAWETTSTGAYAYYENNSSYKDPYGALYNWFAVDYESNGNKFLCPIGWRVPSHNDWTQLEQYICYETGGMNCESIFPYDNTTEGWLGNNEGSYLAGNSMLWNSGALISNMYFEQSGWLGLPGGTRDSGGTYSSIGQSGYWWSTDKNEFDEPWYRTIQSGQTGISRYYYWGGTGRSVKCVKDMF
jgi:uncharacterized protein (TIGR02145 family)